MQVRFDVIFPDFKLPAFCDAQGNTPIHKLVTANLPFNEFASKLKELSTQSDFFEMLTTTNNNGEMPVLSVKRGQQDTNEKIVLLADYFRQIKIKPLSELINLEELGHHYANETAQVQNNLSIAAQVVNLTRPLFKESSSHPELNFVSNQEQEEVRIRLESLMSAFNKNRGNNFFETSVEMSKKAQVGNCENYTWVSLDILLKQFPQTVAQRYRIEGGDHTFIIIDTELKQETAQTWKSLPVKMSLTKVYACTKSFSFPWWSENAVVCDPWNGFVYPVREMPVKLMTREYSYDTNDTRKTNWLGRVNPQLHYLERKKLPEVDLVADAIYKKRTGH